MDLRALVRNRLPVEQFARNESVHAYASKNFAGFIDLMDMNCESTSYCEVLNENGDILLIDTVHLTVQGMDYYGNKLRSSRILEKLLIN